MNEKGIPLSNVVPHYHWPRRGKNPPNKNCPHFLMELHVSLCGAVPNSAYLEYIPQLRGITTTELVVEDGMGLMPTSAGLGIDWDRDAMDRLRVG